MNSRYAISSNEEIWIRLCYKFFLTHGFYDWYQVSREDAFQEIMSYSNGEAYPQNIKQRVDILYDSVGA